MYTAAQLPGTPTKAVFDNANLPSALRWLLDKATLVICTANEEAVESCWHFKGNVPYRMRAAVREYYENLTGKQFAENVTFANTETSFVHSHAKFPVYKSDSTLFISFAAAYAPGHADIK